MGNERFMEQTSPWWKEFFHNSFPGIVAEVKKSSTFRYEFSEFLIEGWTVTAAFDRIRKGVDLRRYGKRQGKEIMLKKHIG